MLAKECVLLDWGISKLIIIITYFQMQMNSLADALRCINNAEKRGKRQVMLR